MLDALYNGIGAEKSNKGVEIMFPFVTVTGRRVSVERMVGKHERLVLLSQKSPTESVKIAPTLISLLVTPAVKISDLTIGEETDLLYLVRLVGLRNLLPFTYKCPGCKQKHTYQVDIRGYRRRLFQCGDSACPCHDEEIRNYDLDKLKASEDPRAAADFSRVPEDHMEKTPPQMTFTLEDSGKSVECKFPVSNEKINLVSPIQNHSPDIINTALLQCVKSIDGIMDREKVAQILMEDISQFDRYAIRDYVDKFQGGVDNSIDVDCKVCGYSIEIEPPMDSSFFLPKQSR